MAFSTATYLDSLNMFGIRLGLEAAFELAERAGHPERDLKFIHLAGTNGKGSTGAMLERALRAVGLRTGFYSSPHLIDVRERFRIDGQAVSPAEFNRCGAELQQQAGAGSYSYFEFATVLAMKIFQAAGVDVVIWETGMGGRLDATNIVTPEASVITNIALDHQKHLGHTLAEIAGEKAGIIKRNVPIFGGNLAPEAREVIARQAGKLGAPFFLPPSPTPELEKYGEQNGRIVQHFTYEGCPVALPLAGAMQRENFRIVHRILSYFAPRWHFDLATALAGLTATNWPGRCQMVNPRFWIDGGHNPDGAAALCRALHELAPERKKVIVYGAFHDKDFRNCLTCLAPEADSFVFVPLQVGGRPSEAVDNLQQIAAELGVESTAASSATTAIRQLLQETDKLVVACGSLYLAGELLENFLPREATLNL